MQTTGRARLLAGLVVLEFVAGVGLGYALWGPRPTPVVHAAATEAVSLPASRHAPDANLGDGRAGGETSRQPRAQRAPWLTSPALLLRRRSRPVAAALPTLGGTPSRVAPSTPATLAITLGRSAAAPVDGARRRLLPVICPPRR